MFQVGRRRVLCVAGAAWVAPAAGLAQVAGRAAYRIASVYVASKAITQPYEDVFLAGLGASGFEIGRNLIYDVRHCDGDSSKLSAAIDEVLALKPDLLVGIEPVAVVMRRKTSTIPIVLTQSSDPVAVGLAKSLAHPGGNVTGMANLNEVLAAKQVELLGEILPRLPSIALLLDTTVPGARIIERHVMDAAAARRTRGVTHVATDRATLELAFADMERNRPGGLLVPAGSGFLFGERRFVAARALSLLLPFVASTAEASAAGALFSYASSLRSSFLGAASFAARVLKGAKPADMPIQQPTKFELVINLKTAQTLGLTIPQSLLLRADALIQ